MRCRQGISWKVISGNRKRRQRSVSEILFAHVFRRTPAVHVSCTFNIHLMLRRLIAIAAFALPGALPAQYLQNVSTSTYSLRTTLTKESVTRYLYQVQFRNEALYNSTSIFTITDVGISGISGVFQWDIHRSDQNQGSGFLGNVYTGPIDPGVAG